MDKKEFIFPGIVLGLVLIIALGLIFSERHGAEPVPTVPQAATSTGIGTGTTTVSATTPALSPDSLGTAGSAGQGGSWNPSGPTSYYPYGNVTLSFDQAAGFKDGLSLRPLALIEDSRCPADVECIQAGTVRISLRTNADGTAETKTIALGDRIIAGDDAVTFVSVAPARLQGNAPAQGAYRLTFAVEPAQQGGGSGTAGGRCYVGGCSSEICSDTPDQASPCIYKPEFACYRKATCERQADGACGWTQTAELSACLANPSP